MIATRAATRLVSALSIAQLMLASCISLVDRRQLMSSAAAAAAAATTISLPGVPSNQPLHGIGNAIGEDESRLSFSVPISRKGSVTISVPKVGYSLYKTNAGEVEKCVHLALEAGYRHLDVATQYDTNEQVGSVIRSYLSGSLTNVTAASTRRPRRSELFISHKVSNEEQSTNRLFVKKAVKKQMSLLSVSHLDLCYIHSPLTDPDRRLATYDTLLELQSEGLVKAIGVCNYGVNPLNEIINAGYTPPSVIQLVLSPFNQHKDVVRWANNHGSVMSCNAWSKLSSMEGPQEGWAVLAEIAKRKGMTKAQVLVCWALQHGYLSVPRTSSKSKIERKAFRENSFNGVQDFLLNQEEMEILDSLDEQLPAGRLGITDGWLDNNILDQKWDPTQVIQ